MVSTGNPAHPYPARGSGSGLALGTVTGLTAALVGGLLWAVLVEVTGSHLGFAAVGVGLLVGLAVSVIGGTSRRLPAVSALLALVGCALGDVLVDARELALVAGTGSPEALRRMIVDPDLLAEAFRAGVGPLSFLFWGIAGGVGYRLAARGRARLSAGPPVRAVVGPDFNGRVETPLPTRSPSVPAYSGDSSSPMAPTGVARPFGAVPAGSVPAPSIARRPADFFSSPSAPRHNPEARQAVLSDHGVLPAGPAAPAAPTGSTALTGRPAAPATPGGLRPVARTANPTLALDRNPPSAPADPIARSAPARVPQGRQEPRPARTI